VSRRPKARPAYPGDNTTVFTGDFELIPPDNNIIIINYL
jgi:hypothetical protein